MSIQVCNTATLDIIVLKRIQIYRYVEISLGARNVKTLKVQCNNLENGCQWVGELGKLEEHMEFCDAVHIPCPNACTDIQGQTVDILRRNLQEHLTNECPRRKHQCPHCEEMGEYGERTTSHLETCPMMIVQCSNHGCDAVLFRCDISTHSLTCDYEPVSCKYAEVGCEERPPRKDLKKHEEDAQLHFLIATEAVQTLKQKATEQTKEIAALKSTLSRGTSLFTFKMVNYGHHKNKNKPFHSQPFNTFRKGYKMCVEVYANGISYAKDTYVSVFACLMKGDNDDSLTWPLYGMVTFELLNQLEDKNHHELTIEANFLATDRASQIMVDGKKGKGWGIAPFISHAALGYQPDKNCQYLKDDTLVFRVTVYVPDYKPWLECTI